MGRASGGVPAASPAMASAARAAGGAHPPGLNPWPARNGRPRLLRRRHVPHRILDRADGTGGSGCAGCAGSRGFAVSGHRAGRMLG
ncbi:hypothetical protein ACFFX0_33090 [Citricoccus parietis]|uniref:Uncharacterized protein n=1 Tax=Citricoccus parietis TaxID=592307 RepID=A0ABV5G9X4_9MICC